MITILATFLRFVLRLRYTIKLDGFECVTKKTRGTLFIPNHPAETDPIIIVTEILRRVHVRPVITERFYRMPLINQVMRLIRAIPMPDLSVGSGYYAKKRVEDALNEITKALKNGENVLFYPSGKIMRSGFERLKGNSGLQKILQAVPEANVVLVRTRGLYGSMFSAVWTGTTPHFLKLMKRAIKTIFQNLIFFIPHRPVNIHFEEAPKDLPINGSVQELNSIIELWYNKLGEEPITAISYSRTSSDLPEMDKEAISAISLGDVPKEIEDKVITKISTLCDTPKEKISMTQRLGADLGMDSLVTATVLRYLEEEYGVVDIELNDLQSVASVVAAAAGAKKSTQGEDKILPTPEEWKRGAKPYISPADTIQAAFLDNLRRRHGYAVIADETSGVISGKKLEIVVHLLAEELKKLDGDKVGIMLPASCGATIAIMGTLMAGKLPVMLNWTMGQQGLRHALDLTGLKHVLTSGTFLDKLDVDLSVLNDSFILFEELKGKFTISKKLKALLKTKLPQSMLLPEAKADDAAVLLFTSGSETVPKAVPLTHTNILTNIRDIPDITDLTADDKFLGFLPPFHSFGLTVTVFLPLIMGLRVAYHPNPNESRKLAKACKRWEVTLTGGTPTFMRGILDAGVPEDFSHLKTMFCGAEAAPEALFERARGLGLNIIEGYGITECSPIVAATRTADSVTYGVGRPLPSVELLIVDPDTHEPLADQSKTGLIFIHGPSVFNGYFGSTQNPFEEVNGKSYYNSGDLGYIKESNLVLAGRLKRFVKIAGEMVSLPAVEDALAKFGQIVVLSKEADGRPMLIVFATTPLSRDEINDTLREAGFPNLVRIKEVRQVEEIPLLGTGKTDLRTLQTWL